MSERAVLITGVSSGIGRETTLLLDERGFRVFGTVRKSEDADRLAGETSDRFVPVVMDLLHEASIETAVAEVSRRLDGGGLHGLVNNAGTIISTPLEYLDLDAFRRLLEVNVTAQIAVTQACLPLLREARGRVIMMGSVSGISALPTIGPYCASKFAMEGLSDSLRMELAPWNIEVSIIEPGSSRTAIMSEAGDSAAAFDGDEAYRDLVEGMKVGFERSARGGIAPRKVAEAVHRALTARRPKTRYLVGPVAYLRSYTRILPDRWRDRIILRTLRRQARDR